MPNNMIHELLLASWQTTYMVLVSTFFTALIGLPIGMILYRFGQLRKSPVIYKCLSVIINITRSIPFIILIIALIPFTRFIIGTSIGVHATMIPLTIGTIPFFARLVENAFQNVNKGLLETGASMGVTDGQLFRKILLPEITPQIIQALTVTIITLINYSAMAGAVGGGGLGDLAIRMGYQRYNPLVILFTVIILVLMVQLVQWLGDKLAANHTH